MAGKIEELLDLMYNTREEIRELKKQETEKQKVYDDTEYTLSELMKEAGIRSAGTDLCTATLKSESYPQVKDMEAFATWAVNNNRTEMIQKRVSSAVFKEYFEQTAEIPDGIDTYDKVTVGIRKR